MDARVGAAGAPDGGLTAVDLPERLFEQALRRALARLVLPAGKGAAFVGEAQEHSLHRCLQDQTEPCHPGERVADRQRGVQGRAVDLEENEAVVDAPFFVE